MTSVRQLYTTGVGHERGLDWLLLLDQGLFSRVLLGPRNSLLLAVLPFGYHSVVLVISVYDWWDEPLTRHERTL